MKTTAKGAKFAIKKIAFNLAEKGKSLKKLDCLLRNFSNFPFIIFSILIIFFSHPLLGKEVQIKIMKVDSSPKIDGYLEQSFWDKIEPLKEFVQYDPYNGKPPSEKTFVYLAFDEDNLYVAFNCLDSQAKKIKGDLTPREQFSANDYVSIIIDTYYDKRNAYYFYLNPKGVQRDSPGDYLWKSGALINEDGWSAEFWIPFKSIRFPTGSSKPWGINFKRYIFRLKETDLLTNVGRDDVLLEKSALLTGLEGVLTSGIIRWQISRYIYLSSYIQHDSHYKRVNLDLLLGIELGMGNLISLSYKGFYPFEGSPYENSARSFVIKASYLIRI